MTAAPPSAPRIQPSINRVETISQDILRTAGRPLEQGLTLPAGAYTDPSFYAWEMEHIFRKEWISVAHVSMIPKPGDYMALDLAGEPIVVVRGKDEVVRVLSRVCKHRGMDIMPVGFGHEPCGNKRVLLCPYHFWGYELDGQLKGAPEMQKACGFNRKDVRLHEFRSEVFEGFVFVTLDPDAPPLESKLGPLRDRFLGRWSMGEAECVWQRTWPSDFNWKVLVENFMEPYHHMGSHAKTLEPMMPSRGCWTEPADEHFSAVHLPLKDQLVSSSDGGRDLCAFRPYPKLDGEDFTQWWVFLGFPTFLLFQAPDRFYWYRLIPTGPTTSELTTTMFVHPSAKAAPDYEEKLAKEIEGIITIHTEDIEACIGIQRGVGSAGWTQGRLSHLEEPIWQFQQYLARKIRGGVA